MMGNLSESPWIKGLKQLMKKKGEYPYARIIVEALKRSPLTILINGNNGDMR